VNPTKSKPPVLDYRTRRSGHPLWRGVLGGFIGFILGLFLSVIPLIMLHQISSIDKSFRLELAMGCAMSGAILLGMWSASEKP